MLMGSSAGRGTGPPRSAPPTAGSRAMDDEDPWTKTVRWGENEGKWLCNSEDLPDTQNAVMLQSCYAAEKEGENHRRLTENSQERQMATTTPWRATSGEDEKSKWARRSRKPGLSGMVAAAMAGEQQQQMPEEDVKMEDMRDDELGPRGWTCSSPGSPTPPAIRTPRAGEPRPEGLEHMQYYFGMPESPTGKCQYCKSLTPLWCVTCRWWICRCFAELQHTEIQGTSCRLECPCGTSMQYVEIQAALKRGDPFHEYKTTNPPQWVQALTYKRIYGRAANRWRADRSRIKKIYCFLDSLKVRDPGKEEVTERPSEEGNRSDLGEALANLKWITEKVQGLWETEQNEERGELKREVKAEGAAAGSQEEGGKKSRSR